MREIGSRPFDAVGHWVGAFGPGTVRMQLRRFLSPSNNEFLEQTSCKQRNRRHTAGPQTKDSRRLEFFGQRRNCRGALKSMDRSRYMNPKIARLVFFACILGLGLMASIPLHA